MVMYMADEIAIRDVDTFHDSTYVRDTYVEFVGLQIIHRLSDAVLTASNLAAEKPIAVQLH